MKSIITSYFLFIVFIGCSEKKPDTKAEAEKLMELSREWSRAASTDSVEKTLSFWAEDAVILPPGQAPVIGKAAIRQMVEGMSNIPGFKISWEPLSAYVSESGDLAYILEQNQITMNDSTGKPITEYNKAVTIWKKQTDGSWKNVVDTWNADPSRNK
jgi:uncharacterized protein (TIGR02246 family)